MAINDQNKVFAGSGMDGDSAPEYVAPNDVLSATNLRVVGTSANGEGYRENLESNILISGSLPSGVNRIVGGGKFNDIGKIVAFRFNSAGENQIVLYDSATQTEQVIYTDGVNSGGNILLPLDPQQIVTAILVNKTYLVWWAKNLEVGYTNLNTLASGGYGTVLWEDLSLLKPQCLPPPTWSFGSDQGTPANYLYSNLGQFAVQYVNSDFNYSCWSTWSKRATPYQENTPQLGADVSKNNYLIVSVNIGSIRAAYINIACRFGLNIFYNIKSVTRAYVTALTHTSVDVSTEIFEAYNPATNIYSFAFYNNTANVPITSEDTSLNYDYIWPSNAGSLINGNIIALADWTTLYPRPNTAVTIAAVGYNPNIGIPTGTFPDPLRAVSYFPGASGSGAGGHRRIMSITIGGTPHTNDEIVTMVADIRNANATINYTYIVPLSLNGNLAGVIAAYTPYFPSSSYVLNGDGTYTITWTDAPYYGLSTFAIELFFGGATVANSIPSIPDNSKGQLALSYRDYKGRFLPLCTNNTYQWVSPSYAQVNGNAIQLSWTITNAAAPAGAVDYQWVVTAPQVNNMVDTIATLLIFKGSWNAASNTPSLAINSGNVGDTYQVTTPASPTSASYHNLGHNDTYNTGDYIVDNGLSYDLLPKTFGNLANNSILAFSLNSLKIYNDTYQQEGVDTIVAYDFTPGDRCTLHYWIGFAMGVETFTLTGGSGYTDGIYNISLTGGTGSGATAQVTVSGGVVTAVTITNPGTAYSIGDSLTGTIPVGAGWSITVTGLTPSGINYFNNPCIDLAVLGYDAGSYIVKVENSSALTYSGGHILYNGVQIDVRNIFLRLYSPALQNQTSQTAVQSTTVWCEIGERFTITNGLHDVLKGTITDGGVYYKTRQFSDAVKPYVNPPVETLSTDLNYSDFYASAFWSAGRTRTYYDELEQTTQGASIINSQNYILGSKINGLNRFFPSTIFGEGDGQTSSSQGEIQVMWQRGQVLVIGQELNFYYCPINIAFTQLNETQTQESISQSLFNNGRYAAESVGIGTAKESFCTRFDKAYFVSPQYSEPFEINVEAGIRSISGKMSKFFKSIIQTAYAAGKKLFMFYNEFYEEPILAIQAEGGVLYLFPFAGWNPFNNFSIAPSDVTATPNGAHCTASYNATTGVVTYTPATNYVGTDSATFTFNTIGGPVTVNNCLQWTAGSGNVNPFVFNAQTGVPLSTEIVSNSVLINGNDYPVSISITGGDYSLDGGVTWTNLAGTVSSGTSVEVRVLSSGSNSTSTSCTLTVDSQNGTFTVTTAAAGNYTVEAKYSINIISVVNGTATGTPAAFNPCNLNSGNSLSAAYTTITAGTIQVNITGQPGAIPGHTQLYLAVAGTTIDSVTISSGSTYTLTFGSPVSDPTTIKVGVQTI